MCRAAAERAVAVAAEEAVAAAQSRVAEPEAVELLPARRVPLPVVGARRPVAGPEAVSAAVVAAVEVVSSSHARTR
jgi:hypothetical protein